MNSDSASAHGLSPLLSSLLATLETILSEMQSMVVAFSGGVDSTLLLRVTSSLAMRERSMRYIAVTTSSATSPAHETHEARDLASSFGAPHVVVDVDELETPGYADNPPNRCYLCKQTLYPVCFDIARRQDMRWVVDGVNCDDLGDYRPGLKAAAEMGVRHPLVEAGLDKAAVRSISAFFDLPTADKPASPCLSSRFPYGVRITHERLRQVASAEAALRALGFRDLRVRYLEDIARVEIGAAEHDRLLDAGTRRAIEAGVAAAGFTHVEIASTPLRSGSLNDALLNNPGARSGPARGLQGA